MAAPPPAAETRGGHSTGGVQLADEEDEWDAMQERQYARMLADGTHTLEQVEQMRRERRYREEAAVCGSVLSLISIHLIQP